MAYSSLMHGALSSPVTLIWWYGVLQVISLITYLAWLWNEGQVGSGTKSVFIVVVIISLVVYFTVGSTSLVWATKKQLNRGERMQKIQGGVLALFLASDTPLLIIHLTIARDIRLVAVLQGIDLSLRVLSFTFGFLFLWIVFMVWFVELFHSRGYNRSPLDHHQQLNRQEVGRAKTHSSTTVHTQGAGTVFPGGTAPQYSMRRTYNLNAVGGMET